MNLKTQDLDYAVWHSSFDHHSVGECMPNQPFSYSVDGILQACRNSVSCENSEKTTTKTSFNVINPNLFGLLTLTLPHISFSPFFSLSAHTIALTLPASPTCWQQFVSRYQFSGSSLRGREGCGNHLYLRLFGSVPLGMLADTCHWAAVRQKGCGMWAQATQVTVISFQKPLKLKP